MCREHQGRGGGGWAEKAQGENRATYDLRTWLGEGGRSYVNGKLLCPEEKSLLLSVLLLKGKVSAEACCALGGSAVSCDPSIRRITPLWGLESSVTAKRQQSELRHLVWSPIVSPVLVAVPGSVLWETF